MFNPKVLIDGGKAFLGANSPAILTGLGITGAIATGVGAFKAGWNIRGEMSEKPTLDEFMEKKLWKKCIFPAGACAGTVACFIGLNSQIGRIIAATTSVITLKDQENLDLRKAMNKTLKKGDIEKINQERAKDILARNPQPDEAFIIHTGHGNDLFFDNRSKLYFRCSMQRIDEVINTINTSLLAGQDMQVSEVYYNWGIKDAPIWCDHIWMIPEQDIGIPFQQLDIDHTQAHVTTKGEAAVIIDWLNDFESGFFQFR